MEYRYAGTWSDERIWDELSQRLRAEQYAALVHGTILQRR